MVNYNDARLRRTNIIKQGAWSCPVGRDCRILNHGLKRQLGLACENSRFSSLFAAGDVSFSSRNVLSDEERGETSVFAG